MRIPAVALAAAFAGGILLGRAWHPDPSHFSRVFLLLSIVSILLLILAALFLGLRSRLRIAAFTCLLSWAALGTLGIIVASRPLPEAHVLRRIAAGQLDLKTPLRWHGILRDEPGHLPWGTGLEMELAGVEAAAGTIPLKGGMRLSFSPKENDPALPEVHAGDEIAVLTQARLPPIFRDAGAFDRREYLAEQNIHLLATVRASSLLERVSVATPTLGTRLARLRGSLRERLDALYPNTPQTAGTLRAMLLGDRSFVDRSESVDFQKTGVFHVLVVAGLHVGALAVFLFWLGKRLRLPQTLATMLLLAGLLAYIAVVEQRTPVLRAGLMTGIVVLASFLYRRLELLNAAALAGILLMLAKPTSVFDTSFQLSFLAVGCIGGLALPWMERSVQPYLRALDGWRDFTRDGAFTPPQAQFRLDLRALSAAMTGRLAPIRAKWVQDFGVKALGYTLRASEVISVSFVLQLGMMPLMAKDFHRVTLLGPLANLFAVPLTGLIVPLGFLTLLSALLVFPVGRALAWPLGWLVALQGHVVGWFAGFGSGSYRIPGPPVWVVSVFFASGILLAAAIRAEKGSWRWFARAAMVGMLLAAAVIATYPFAPKVERGDLEVDVLDVGQGDSILIISPKGSTLLIDGGGRFEGFRGREEAPGPDPGEDAVSAYLWSRGIQKIDAVALTHAHQDHVGGLYAVLENFKVGQLWLGREEAASALERLKKSAENHHAPLKHELRGQRFDWDGVQVEFLWPQTPPEEVAPSAKNNDSLVVRLQYKERSILLPGDAEKQVEYTILSEPDAAELHADVLKVGHHGSKNSTMPEFLKKVAPEVAIISAGEENPYGHPSPELLERLRESGARILRTDRDGAIQVLTDGHSIRVVCFATCPLETEVSGNVQTPDNHESQQ
jgi:competence protein ComEC